MREKKYFDEITLMKGWCILLAVVGHSFPDAVKGFNIIGENSFANFLLGWIYCFHMAAFFACAGFLMVPKLADISEARQQLKKRFKRLMIPYFFYSLLYLGMKSIVGGQFIEHPLTSESLIGILLGDSPCFSAWFLWTLFVISSICILLRKITIKWLLLISAILAIVLKYLPADFLPIGFMRVFGYMVWFFLGGFLGVNYSRISRISYPLLPAIGGFSLLTLLHFFGSSSDLYYLETYGIYLKTLAGIVGTWGFSMWLETHRTTYGYKCLKLFGVYCMDIYMLSMYVLVPLRIIFVNFSAKNYINYYVWIVFAIICGTMIPIVLSKFIVRKNKVLNMLLVGG